MTSCNRDSASLNCFIAGEALGLGEQGRALSFRALGRAGDQLIELGDRLVMLALLGQDLGAKHRRLVRRPGGAWPASAIAASAPAKSPACSWSRPEQARADARWRLVG